MKKFFWIKVLSLVIIISSLSIKLKAQTLDDAIKLLQSERYEDANDLLKKIIENEPQNSDAYFYYGESILKSYLADPYSNTLNEVVSIANDLFQQGINKDSTNALNYIGKGMILLLSKNDTINADVYFKKAEQTVPKKGKKFTNKDFNILIKLAYAELYSSKPRYYKALAYLERAKTASIEKAKEPKLENPDVYIAIGDILLEQGNASAAVMNYNKAVYINEKLAEPIVKIGKLYMRSRNLQEARNYFDRAKEIDSTYAPLYRAYGELYSMGGLANFSKINYKKFLELSGNNIPAKVQYVNSLFKAKDYKECVANIEDILTYDKSRNYLNRIAAYSCYEMRPPDYEKALYYIEEFFKNSKPEKIIPKDHAYYGRILLKMKDTSSVNKAFEHFMIAYEMDTTDMDLLSEIANNAYYYKNFSLAIDLFNKKINKGTATTTDYFNLGKTYYQIAQAETDTSKQFNYLRNADKTFTKLTELEPNNIQAYLWIANTYFSMDPENKSGIAKPKYELVIEKALSDTVKYAKELFEAYRFMGSYYLFTSNPDFDLAQSYFEKIINLDPRNNQWKIQGYNSLGFMYTKKKQYQKAIDIYKKVLEIDPKNDGAKKAIEGLNKTIKSQQEQ